MATKLTAARIATAAGCRMVICRRAARAARAPRRRCAACAARLRARLRAHLYACLPARRPPAASAETPANLVKIIAGSALALCSIPPPSPSSERAQRGGRARPGGLCSGAPATQPRRLIPHRLASHLHSPPVAAVARRGRKRWILSVPVRGEVWLDGGAVAAVRDRKKSLFSAGIHRVEGEFEAQVGCVCGYGCVCVAGRVRGPPLGIRRALCDRRQPCDQQPLRPRSAAPRRTRCVCATSRARSLRGRSSTTRRPRWSVSRRVAAVWQ